MNINMKYYIVTIGSIFLALGIGIIVGFNLNYDQELSKQQSEVLSEFEDRFDSLNQEKADLNTQIEDLTKEQEKLTSYISQNYNLLITNALTDRNTGIIITNEKNDYSEEIENLIKEDLLKDTTFISVNYDIHIDNTIAGLYKKDNPIMLDYGVDFTNFDFRHSWKKPQSPIVKLYKIHGSLNWLYCPVCNSLTITPYEGGIMRLLDNIDEAKCLACDEITIPIIIPPTYFKNMTNVFVSTVWREVEKTLRESDLLIFCGYSFSDADIHIKYMIKRVQTSRKKAPLKFMVFNSYEGKREDSKRKEEERYKRFLGEGVIFTDNSFEEFASDPVRFIKTIRI